MTVGFQYFPPLWRNRKCFCDLYSLTAAARQQKDHWDWARQQMRDGNVKHPSWVRRGQMGGQETAGAHGAFVMGAVLEAAAPVLFISSDGKTSWTNSQIVFCPLAVTRLPSSSYAVPLWLAHKSSLIGTLEIWNYPKICLKKGLREVWKLPGSGYSILILKKKPLLVEILRSSTSHHVRLL